MLAHPELALDLPFRVLISQQADGRTLVSYHPAETLQRYGLDAAAIQTLKNWNRSLKKSPLKRKIWLQSGDVFAQVMSRINAVTSSIT